MRKLLLLPVLLVAANMSGFAQLFGVDFYAHTIRPPELYVDNVKKVAVLNFKDENNPYYKYWNNEADNGSKMADYITSGLLNEKIGLGDEKKLFFTGFRTNIFTIVERTQLDNVLREQKLGASGAIDDAEASQAGKLLGIDMIITGGLAYTHKDARSQTENKDKDGKVTGITHTVTRTVFATTRVKYISVATGQILAAKEFADQESHSLSDAKQLPFSVLNPPEVIADGAFRKIGNSVSLHFTPTFEYRAIDILRMKNKDYRDMGKEANEFLKDGKIDRAILVYAKIQEMDPYSQEAAYNQGALQEGTGNYEKALANYKLALEIDPSDQKFKDAVTRAEAGIKVTKYLAGKGIVIAPYEFAEAGSDSKKLADMVTLRGHEKDRYDVFEKMDITSPVVMKVAGGRELQVIEKSDTWVKVKLLGGKEGYIEVAHLK